MLYDNHQPWTTRAVTAFMAAQWGLWSTALYEFTAGAGAASRAANAKLADPSPLLSVMLHPGWALLGLAVTAAGSVLAHDYVTNAVSEIREDRAARTLLLRTHTLLGSKTDPPLQFARGELRGVQRIGADRRRITLCPVSGPERRFWLFAEGLRVAEPASAAAVLGISSCSRGSRPRRRVGGRRTARPERAPRPNPPGCASETGGWSSESEGLFLVLQG